MALRSTSMALRRAAVAAKPVRAFSAVSDAADAPAASNRNVGKPLGTYQWDDPLMMQGMLNEEETMIYETAKAYAKEELLPGVTMANRHETFDRKIMSDMGELGLLGPTINGYGCAGVGYNSYGLIA
eukprot:CAMPEP_0182548492 /NCGR_PEP_ID=MMETSP1323-20130603/38878_1 /TAXON_ID=236787 /ORGANISM="Florenciella parvula, Strain RCC1693" /LENGTH=126 /DNA_ID=CAMNT_0024759889 /DNA_START=8 /DNA_END=384 /DNA_ORIENTATION=+